MPENAANLRRTAEIVSYFGLWTGTNFADHTTGHLSITAAIYRAVTHTTPNVFLTDETASLALIRANTDVMAAVQALSACLDTQPPLDDDGTPDHIEHIERYTTDKALHGTTPPSEGEVIGRIIRAADTADNPTGQAVLPGIPRQRTAA